MDYKTLLQESDESALQALMDAYGPVLKRTAILLVKDRQLAEEVVQDTFITAFRKSHQLSSNDAIKGWLITITLNGCRSRMRTWNWRNLFPAKEETAFDQLEETDLLPEAKLLTAIEEQRVHQAVQALPYTYREPITLYYFHDMTVDELAKAMNAKPNTVKTRLARGRAILKKELLKGGDDG